MLGRNLRNTRSIDDTVVGGSSSRPTYGLVDVTDPAENRRRFLLGVETSIVHRDWYNQFAEYLSVAASDVEALKQYGFGGPFTVSRHGRLVIMVTQADYDELLEFVRSVADETLVPAPALEFDVRQFDENGLTTTRVYYRGHLTSRHEVEFPRVSDGLRVYHEHTSRLVTITASNPLYPVTPELVQSVQGALQANSVPLQPAQPTDDQPPLGTSKAGFQLSELLAIANIAPKDLRNEY